jgi:hypothetical protein
MARKRLNGVWRSGSGEEIWYTGLSFADFEVKGKDLFERNMRMVSLDTNGGISAVWHPGSDGQVCYIGMSRDDFVRHDTECLNEGMRLVSLRVAGGRHDAVWRTGSGRQEIRWTPSIDDLFATDKQHFAEGMRLQTLQQDFDKGLYYGVWRSDLGTGAQWVRRGIPSNAEFTNEDARQTAAGLRLCEITSLKGLTGIWRTGTDSVAWALEEPLDAFGALEGQHLNQGLRMVNLSVGYV